MSGTADTHRTISYRIRRRATASLDALLFERRFGLDTSVQPSRHHEEGNRHEAIRWRLLGRALRPEELGADEVFLDVGCGKGRGVFEAARLHPFSRVIGFDLSPEVVAVAQRNIDRNIHRLRCRQVELHIADAATWPVPDDVTLILLYNPFGGATFEAFLARMLESFDRRPRRLWLIYVNPVERMTVERTDRFQLRRTLKGGVRGPEVRMYEARLPTGGG